MEAGGKEGPRPLRIRVLKSGTAGLDLSALAVSAHVDQSEGGSFAAIRRLNCDDVLVILRANLQLGDRTRILVAFQFFVLRFLALVHVNIVAMLLFVALYNLSIFPELVAIKVGHL